MKSTDRAIVAVLAFALLLVSAVYSFAWIQSGYDKRAVSFGEDSERITDTLSALSTRIDSDSIEGQACQLWLSVSGYELRKDIVRNGHRYTTLFSNLAHTNALFLTILVMIVAGLVFSIFQMATAYGARGGTGSQIEIEAANVKVRTGYVSIAMSVIAIIALSFYLSDAHEVKELSGSQGAVVDLALGEFIESCGGFVREEQLPQ